MKKFSYFLIAIVVSVLLPTSGLFSSSLAQTAGDFSVVYDCKVDKADGTYDLYFRFVNRENQPLSLSRSTFTPAQQVPPPEVFDIGETRYARNSFTEGNVVWTARVGSRTKTATANTQVPRECWFDTGSEENSEFIIAQQVNANYFETDTENNTVTYSIDVSNNGVCKNKLDIAYLIEETVNESNSQNENYASALSHMQSIAKEFVDQINSQAERIAVFTYGDDTEYLNTFSTNREETESVINSVLSSENGQLKTALENMNGFLASEWNSLSNPVLIINSASISYEEERSLTCQEIINNQSVEICHTPVGETTPQTMQVSANSLLNYLEKGDIIGQCPEIEEPTSATDEIEIQLEQGSINICFYGNDSPSNGQTLQTNNTSEIINYIIEGAYIGECKPNLCSNLPVQVVDYRQDIINQINNLKNQGFTVVIFDISSNQVTDSQFLQSLATNGFYYQDPDANDIQELYTNLNSLNDPVSPSTVVWDDVSNLTSVASFVSASNSGVFENDKVTWDLGDMACNSSISLSYTFEFYSSNSQPFSRSNIIKATNALGSTYESNEIEIQAVSPWLTATITDNETYLEESKDLVYQIEITNTGDSVANDFIGSINIPESVSIVSTNIPGAQVNNSTITFTIGSLGVSEQLQFEVFAEFIKNQLSGQLLTDLSLSNDNQYFEIQDVTDVGTPIQPDFSVSAKCVELNENTFTAHFGYNNRNNEIQVLDISVVNLINGNGEIIGTTPDSLEVGSHPDAFSVEVPISSAVIWTATAGEFEASAQLDASAEECDRVSENILNNICSLNSYSGRVTSLGNWTNNGTPLYLDERDEISQNLLEIVAASLPERAPVPENNPEYLATSAETNIELRQDADVWVTFVDEGAGYRNVLGYYTYPIDNPPNSVEDIPRLFIIFPNSSKVGSGGGLIAGDKVRLGSFEANTGIGWFILPDGWAKSNRSCNYIYFSHEYLNPEPLETQRQHNVQLLVESENKIILSFEDLPRNGGSDDDFNDVIYYITLDPIDAIEQETIVKARDNSPEEDAEESEEEEIDTPTSQGGGQSQPPEIIEPEIQTPLPEIPLNFNLPTIEVEPEESPVNANIVNVPEVTVVQDNVTINLLGAQVSSECDTRSINLTNVNINSSNPVTSIDYSVNNGFSWIPSAQTNGLGTQNVILNEATVPLADGFYEIAFRINTSSGRAFLSNAVNYTHNCEGNLEILAHYIQNGFAQAIVDNDGAIILNDSLASAIFVEVLGAPGEVTLDLYRDAERQNNNDFVITTLDHDEEVGIWTGEINRNDILNGYIYPVIRARNTEIVDQKIIGQFKLPGRDPQNFLNNPVSNSESQRSLIPVASSTEEERENLNYSIYFFNGVEWEEFNYFDYFPETEISRGSENLKFTLFPGQYYISVRYSNGSTYLTDTFEIEKTSIVEVSHKENPLPFVVGFLDGILNDLEVEITTAVDNSDLMGTLPILSGEDVTPFERALQDVLFESPQDSEVLIAYWTRWDPYSTERLSFLDSVLEQIRNQSLQNKRVIIFTDVKNYDAIQRVINLFNIEIEVQKITDPTILDQLSRDPSQVHIYKRAEKEVIVLNGLNTINEYQEKLERANFLNK